MSDQTIIAIAAAAFFCLITIIQTWRIHNYNKKNAIRKSIEFYYEIKKTISIDESPYDLSIKYNSNSYKNIFIVEGIIGNGGNVVFSKNDLLKPLIINSNNPIKILEHEIIDKTKDDLEFEINQNTDNGNDIINVLINNFEPKDAFKFRLLIASDEDKIWLILNGLIKDENISIKPKNKQISKPDYMSPLVDDQHWKEQMWPIYFAILFGFIAGIYFLFLEIQKLFYLWLINQFSFTVGSSEILSFILAVLVYIGLTILIIRIAKKIKSRGKKKKQSKEPSLTGFGPWFDLRIRTKNTFDHLD